LATGGITVFDNEEFNLVLSGVDLERIKAIKFTTVNNTHGEDCHGEGSFHTSDTFTEFQDLGNPGLRSIRVPGLQYWPDQRIYFICVATDQPQDGGSYTFIHQGGEDKTLQIYMDKAFLPVWVMICLIAVLLCMSGLFSGLNLGLMSLDQTELKIVQNTGTDAEKNYASAIMPIRAMGNFLLCSILLGNVLVNNTLTILLDTLTGGGGLVAVIGATLGIVVFGEIIPQAICSRHGLAVGARTIWLTKFFMLITAPLSFPISKILDCVLGAEVGTVYNKTRLMELLKVTEQYNGLENNEINMVTGALVLKQKSVKDVMTNLDDCFMLPLDAKLDFDTISEIKEQGYSRIPVHGGGDRNNVVHLLFARDLLFVDPDDEKPIEEICKFYKNDVNFVYSDTILTDMFDEFKSGEKGHLALVQEVNNDGDADPFYETVGLVTLEDIIEEIIQQEIIDETDVVIDNKTKKKRKRERYKKDAEVKMFQGVRNNVVSITPHENMAVLQFLTTSVRAFSPENINQMILRKMLSMDVYRELKIQKESREARNNNDEKLNEKCTVIMTKGKPCDFFVMVIEGKVEVTIGKEERKFQDGPFSFYGEQMLEQALLNMNPSSPMVTSHSKGINLSASMQSSVSQDVKSAPHLKKTNTQLQLSENGGSGRRSTSADCTANSALNLQRATWIPDYTLKALTDVVYLKVRRNTYMVAIKASRMAKSNQGMHEGDLSDVLAKVIEDDEFGRTPSIRSPDRWEPGSMGRSNTELTASTWV
jgi:metal transporter CNNM